MIAKEMLSTYRHYRRGSTRPPQAPLAVWIEPTNACNLKCIMCPTPGRKRESLGYMDMGLYRKIIDEAKQFAAYIVLCISGEPLLNRELPEMVFYAKQSGLKVALSTNASVLTRKLSQKLLEADIDAVYFSFDGCTAETYERIRVGSDFSKTLANIVAFLELKRDLGKRTIAELQILLTDDAGEADYRENIRAFKDNFSGLPLDALQTRQPSTWGNQLASTDKFKFKELGDIYSPCSYLWCSMFILWNGDSVACCSDFFADNVLGRFPDQSLREIWAGETYQRFRSSMLDRSYEKYFKTCKNCDSLWSETIMGLPPGIRGVLAFSLATMVGFDKVKHIKKLAGALNPEFAIKSVEGLGEHR